MRPNSCRVQVGAGKAMNLMYWIRWMDRKYCWGAEEGKKVQGSSSNWWKHIKLNKSLRQSTSKLMKSTLVTRLFNFGSKEKGNGIHKKLMKLTNTWRKTSSKLRATRIPTSAAKPWSFLCEKCWNEYTMRCQTIPKSPTLKMTQKIHNIDQPNPSPCL